jgi:hypothetical protein
MDRTEPHLFFSPHYHDRYHSRLVPIDPTTTRWTTTLHRELLVAGCAPILDLAAPPLILVLVALLPPPGPVPGEIRPETTAQPRRPHRKTTAASVAPHRPQKRTPPGRWLMRWSGSRSPRSRSSLCRSAAMVACWYLWICAVRAAAGGNTTKRWGGSWAGASAMLLFC